MRSERSGLVFYVVSNDFFALWKFLGRWRPELVRISDSTSRCTNDHRFYSVSNLQISHLDLPVERHGQPENSPFCGPFRVNEFTDVGLSGCPLSYLCTHFPRGLYPGCFFLFSSNAAGILFLLESCGFFGRQNAVGFQWRKFFGSLASKLLLPPHCIHFQIFFSGQSEILTEVPSADRLSSSLCRFAIVCAGTFTQNLW